MTRSKGALPATKYTGLKYKYGYWEVINITTLDNMYYHGKTSNGNRTHGCRRDLVAVVTDDTNVVGLIDTLKGLQAAAKRMREPHEKAIADINHRLQENINAAIEKAKQPVNEEYEAGKDRIGDMFK